MAKPNSVDEYITGFDTETKKMLIELRTIIKKAAPKAAEVISYSMPAYKQNGMLVYFAAYEKHIGFYPMPSAIAYFKEELAMYKTAKGSVQFPLDKPLPLQLIKKIVQFRLAENVEKAGLKKQ